MQSKDGLVGSRWTGLFQNLRRKLPTSQDPVRSPRLRASHSQKDCFPHSSDSEDRLLLYSRERIKLRCYFLGTKLRNLNHEHKNVKFAKTIFNRHTSPDVYLSHLHRQKSEVVSFVRELGMKF